MTCSDAGAFRRLLAVGAVLGGAVVGVAGCMRPPLLVPVKGVVLLDGRPLSSGVVQFQPAAGQTATGEIAGDGTFTLSRYVPNDGVPPGTYRVAVTAFDPLAEVQSVENLIVPVRYTRFGSSGIEFTVFPGTTEPLVVSLFSATETGDPESAPSADAPSRVSADEPASRAPDSRPSSTAPHAS
ncbi:MAG: hypothetical protein ACKO4T_15075 [Planctomycetaceae bacterium]